MARPGLDDAAKWVRELLPGDWTVTVARPSRNRSDVRITAPSGSAVDIEVTTLKDASPRAVAGLPASSSPRLAVADWISPRAREVLRSGGTSYIDATGNAEIRLDDPAVYVRTTGADRNPAPKSAPGPRLRGPKAWALLRTLAETPPPFGVRELAEAVDVDPGYVSRVLRALEGEVLVTREPRGPVTDVDWEGVIRQGRIDLLRLRLERDLDMGRDLRADTPRGGPLVETDRRMGRYRFGGCVSSRPGRRTRDGDHLHHGPRACRQGRATPSDGGGGQRGPGDPV